MHQDNDGLHETSNHLDNKGLFEEFSALDQALADALHEYEEI